ncbi:MAG: hypothetical protein M1826_004455, partial [Phylliscum demangeonii]
MSQGLPVNQRVPRRKESIDDLLKDPKLQEMAQSSGYPVEELAKARRRSLDAQNAVWEFKKKLTEAEKVREVTPEEKGQLQALVKAMSQQMAVFSRMSKGFPGNQPVPRKKSMDDLLKDPKLHEMAQSSNYPMEELAKARRRYLDAHSAAVAFKQKLAEAEKVREVTSEEKGQLQALVKDTSNQETVLRRMSQGLPGNQPVSRKKSIDDLLKDPKLHEIAKSSGYPVEELAKAKRRSLDAINAADEFKKVLAEDEKVREVTPEEKGQLQALVKNASQQNTIFRRMSQGKPVTLRPTSQEQASQASPASPARPAKEDPSTTHPPVQMSGPGRLLAPFVSSASHLLQGVGRQWRAMPWTRYLAEPRLNRVTPAEWLRAEHVLP